jgi:hypothetical protein
VFQSRPEVCKHAPGTYFFESNPYYHIESNGNALLIIGKERLASIKEIKALFDFGKRLKSTIYSSV